jgi:hypothetical protein
MSSDQSSVSSFFRTARQEQHLATANQQSQNSKRAFTADDVIFRQPVGNVLAAHFIGAASFDVHRRIIVGVFLSNVIM